MVEALGAVVGLILGVCALLALLWRWVILPNLREQLGLIRETHKQVTENRHENARPTVLDRLEDVERGLKDVAGHVDLLALNTLALLRKFGAHVGESEEDRRHLWLIVESLMHEDQRKERKFDHDHSRDSGGTEALEERDTDL